ncbi:MlaD family protein [Acetonema longum]|uniref:Mammalian cell entry related domain protein n=1 Tax=Acetonema longum DSM 6540 TaxID=1009370 RepID=F7NM28_9FIRM|nr:MlaD family protein [Acetonema longum]EGO62954.1 Mammalian cell entry related domain protein [Acetonema longum DSM 6540]
MVFSTEAKVGAVSILALALLAGFIVMLSGNAMNDEGYPVYVVYDRVNGLKPGNIVRYAGVDIGRVQNVKVTPAGVEAELFIQSGAQIPQGAKFAIGTDGLMGEKYIDITPPARRAGNLSGNDRVSGETPKDLDQLIATADEVLNEARTLIRSMNDVIGDEKVREALKGSAVNLKKVTDNLDAFSASLARMAVNNEQNVADIASNLRAMSADLKSTAARVDKLVADVDNNGQTAKDLRETLANVKSASARIEKMAAALEGVATDPSTAENIRETLKNARQASEKANKVLDKVTNIRMESGLDVLYQPNEGAYRTNLDLKVSTSDKEYALLGIKDIGEENLLNLQLGTNYGSWGSRYGIVDGKAGVGVDGQVSSRWKLSLDAYDPNDFRLKLRSEYDLGRDTYLVGETDDVRQNTDKNTYFGLKKIF